VDTVLITGATDGIGKQTATELAARGFRVFVHGRTAAKASKTCDEIRSKVMAAKLEPVHADLSSLTEVRRLAEDVRAAAPSLKVLANNAGVYMNDFERSADGFEMTFAVNHLAHFLLTNLLLDRLRAASSARVIHVSSVAHTRGAFDLDTINDSAVFSPYRSYAASKLANVLFSNALARRTQKEGIASNSLHPGVITTKLLKAGFNMSGASVARGAETTIFLATSPLVEGVTGRYFADAREAAPSSLSRDEKLQERLWERSAAWTGL
jgi:NAD(P)-dependent dehydrogenase (short-subunit alcohol dehydrogenase family)